MMPNFILIKLKKICIYIGPYETAFNEPEQTIFIQEDDEK